VLAKTDIKQFIKEKAFPVVEVQKIIRTNDFRSEFCSTSTDLWENRKRSCW